MLKVLLRFILSFIFIANSFALEKEEQAFPDIDFSSLQDLEEIDYKNIEQVMKFSEERNLNYAEKVALKIKLQDIVKSGTFIGVIPKGSILVSVKTGATYYTQKDLVVKAYRLNDYEGYKLIINKYGLTSYKVLANQIANVKEITSMHEAPLTYKPVVSQAEYDINDQNLKLTSHLIVHMGLTRPLFLRDLINNKNHFGQTTRYEGTLYGQWNFPLQFGLTTQYENNFGTYADGKYTMQSLSLGPSFKTKTFDLFGAPYSLIAQSRLAVLSNLQVNSQANKSDFSLSQTSLVIGLSRGHKTRLGTIIIGANYQRQWIKASANKTALNISSSNNYNDSFVLSLGHGADWIW